MKKRLRKKSKKKMFYSIALSLIVLYGSTMSQTPAIMPDLIRDGRYNLMN